MKSITLLRKWDIVGRSKFWVCRAHLGYTGDPLGFCLGGFGFVWEALRAPVGEVAQWGVGLVVL